MPNKMGLNKEDWKIYILFWFDEVVLFFHLFYPLIKEIFIIRVLLCITFEACI